MKRKILAVFGLILGSPILLPLAIAVLIVWMISSSFEELFGRH